MSAKKKLKFEDLLRQSCLSKSDLSNSKCSSRHIETLSKRINDWRAFAHHFKLSKEEIKEIEEHPEKSVDLRTSVRNKLVLQIWVAKVGERKANFLVLAEACYKLNHPSVVEDFIVIECKKQTASKVETRTHEVGYTVRHKIIFAFNLNV